MAAAFASLLLLAAAESLFEAPPVAGRATPTSIELSLLAGRAPICCRLWLTPEPGARDAGGPKTRPGTERPVSFRPVETRAAPFACVQVSGRIADEPTPEGATEAAMPAPLLPAGTAAVIELTDLPEGSAWSYRLLVTEAETGARAGAAIASETFRGRLVTVRPRGSSFTFDVFSDCHVFPEELEPKLPAEVAGNELFLNYVLDGISWYRTTRERVGLEGAAVFARMNGDRPDFSVSLGDLFDLHGLGFNPSFERPEVAASAHREGRRAVAALHESGSLYQVLGNWEGESGCHLEVERTLARNARQRYMLNPRPGEGALDGAPEEDYYSWRWGDVLCVALDVRGYSPKPHHLGNDGEIEGKPDEFTLGAEQKAFLERVLSTSDLPYKVTFIHHTVGGNAGDAENSAYGRGGGRAAKVGEQAWVHGLCVKHGVQVFFYGHDHVFTDMVVDGVHYSLPGTTGAPWRFAPEETGYDKSWPDSGYARVHVTPDEMQVEFVALDGRILHEFKVAPRGSGRR